MKVNQNGRETAGVVASCAAKLSFSLIAICASVAFAQTAPTTQPDMHMRRPADELKTMQIAPGYHLELVASDPDLISPTICAWDGNGRMYVAEMRTYMLDINGKDSHLPTSIVSRWEETKGDGHYDKHTIYAKNLLLPRMILPLDDRVLIRETDTRDIYSYRDTNGDGISDEKKKIYEGGPQAGNLEHQPSGLFWDIDNWIYVTHQDERFRFTHGKMEKQHINMDVGQWGLAIDDTGQLLFMTAGAENPAHHFQVNPQYGSISLSGEVADGFSEVFPIEHMSDVEGGPKRLKPEGGLNHFTGCCGGSIYRGDALPADMYGNYILPEPVGRLIRRATFKDDNGKNVVANFYDKKEFIAALDPNFRPVWTATGPDGCLYICDMYHGIIQEANWTREGSYLRPQIQKYGLDKNINGGRIWRLVYDGMKRREQPHMLDETPIQLVAHLRDPNGWWRDTAQKLIILKNDKSVLPALKDMARSDGNALARLHALWTLDGLDSVPTDLLLEKLKDSDPRVRAAAVRIAEPLLKKNDPQVVEAIQTAANDPEGRVVKQVVLSAIYTDSKASTGIVNAALKSSEANKKKHEVVDEIAKRYRENIAKAKAEEEKRIAMTKVDPKFAAVYVEGKNLFSQTCITCHAADGKGTPAPEHNGTTLAPPLAGSKRLMSDPEIVARIVLHGLTGLNNGKMYPGQMPSFIWADNKMLSSILTYARNDFGNKAAPVTPDDVMAVRMQTAERQAPYLIDELPLPMLPFSGIVLSPSAAKAQGSAIESRSSGVDMALTDNQVADWKTWVSEPGTYAVFVKAASAVRAAFDVDIAGQKISAETWPTRDPGDFAEVPAGVIHVEKGGELPIKFLSHAAMNLAEVRLERRQ